MTPYREAPPVADPVKVRSPAHPEELVAYGLLVGVGAIPVLAVVIEHSGVGAAGTIGGLMMALGALGLVRSRR